MVIVIAIVSLLTLIALHELGHFILAKKFGVKVEEFGIGLPPRLLAKKLGETIFSLNLLPIGAFVRLEGEEKTVKSPQSYSEKPLWQRAAIVLGGVLAFWLVAAVILGVLGATRGLPTAVSAEADQGLVQIMGVAPGSPAEAARLLPGDIILKIQQKEIIKVTEVQELANQFKGQEIIVTLQRGSTVVEMPVMPRVNPPEGQGPLGIALAKISYTKYPWYAAPLQGIVKTAQLTWQILKGLGNTFGSAIVGKGLPEGTQIMGPIGIFDLLRSSLSQGSGHFFYFLAVLASYLAVFNALPIPVVDGGKLLFLAIEAVRRKPMPEKIEQRVNTIFFAALLALFIWASINDIRRLY